MGAFFGTKQLMAWRVNYLGLTFAWVAYQQPQPSATPGIGGGTRCLEVVLHGSTQLLCQPIITVMWHGMWPS